MRSVLGAWAKPCGQHPRPSHRLLCCPLGQPQWPNLHSSDVLKSSFSCFHSAPVMRGLPPHPAPWIVSSYPSWVSGLPRNKHALAPPLGFGSPLNTHPGLGEFQKGEFERVELRKGTQDSFQLWLVLLKPCVKVTVTG
jgi:hypothetical protein